MSHIGIITSMWVDLAWPRAHLNTAFKVRLRRIFLAASMWWRADGITCPVSLSVQ